MTTEVLRLDRDNTIALILKVDGVAQNLAGVTKIQAIFDQTTITSILHETGVIKWAVSGYDTGEIHLDLGAQTIAEGLYSVGIIVYDATYTTGIHWGFVDIQVSATPETGANTEAALFARAQELLKDDTGTYWEAKYFKRFKEIVLADISRVSPYIHKVTLDSVANSKALDMTEPVPAVNDPVIKVLKNCTGGGVLKAEYPVGDDPPNYRNVEHDYGNVWKMDVDSAPASAGEDIDVWYTRLHVLDNTESTLDASEEQAFVQGLEAHAMLHYCQTMRTQMEAAITALGLSTTAIGNIAARITKAIADLDLGRTEAAKVPALVTAAKAEVDLINPEVDQALADLDSGRAFINTLNIGNAPEAMFAQYANTGLNDAAGYFRSAAALLGQAKADESIAVTYSGLAAGELRAGLEKANEARMNLSEANTRLAATRTMQSYEQSGIRKMALYKQALGTLGKRPRSQNYSAG